MLGQAANHYSNAAGNVDLFILIAAQFVIIIYHDNRKHFSQHTKMGAYSYMRFKIISHIDILICHTGNMQYHQI